MKTIGITDLRQRAAEVVEGLETDDEPVIILQRSKKVAYLVAAERYEADLAELAAARRAAFVRAVRESEAEYASGGAGVYVGVDELIAELDRDER